MVKIPLLTKEFIFCLRNTVYLISHGLEKLKAKIFQWEMQTTQLQGRQDAFFFYINYICTATFGGTKGYLGPEDFFHFFVASRPCLANHHMSVRGLRTELWFLALPGKSSARSLAFSY